MPQRELDLPAGESRFAVGRGAGGLANPPAAAGLAGARMPWHSALVTSSETTIAVSWNAA